MLEKVSFRVVHANNEEAGFSASELEKHGPTINGWKSPRSSTYPHEIILRLESRARLGHIQLLLHQYLIPVKIELYIGDLLTENGDDNLNKTNLENVQFILLGHVTMSTNQSTGFKARELKSISVECNGCLVKLIIYQNHKNKYNRHNQVALVAINLLGEKLEEDEELTKSMMLFTFEETHHGDREKHLFSPYDDLAFTMYVDTEVQGLIRKMDHKKQEAVLDERFDYASKLKSTMDHLRKSGEILAKYQLEKQIAASREDFQRAKEKKTQMETFRADLYKTMRIKELLEPNGRITENDEPGRVSWASGMSRSVTELSLPHNMISAASTPGNESITSERMSSSVTTPDSEKKEAVYFGNEEPRFPPLIVKKRRPLTADAMKEKFEKREREITLKEREERAAANVVKPSNLSERAKRYAALPIQVFGEALVEKIFSKNFNVKEEGLRGLLKLLSEFRRVEKKNEPPSKVFRAAGLLLQRTVKDTVFSVFNLTIQVVIFAMDEFARKHRLAGSELSQGLERILPELLSKSGDSALGKNKVAVECIMKLQTCAHIRNLNVISVHLTKPFDTPVHPRLAQSKAEMVEELLMVYGLSTEKYSGLTPRDYVEFGVSALNQPSENVRRVADRVIVFLYQTHPKLVRQHLPLEEDISPKNVQYRQLFKQFDQIDQERKEGGPNMNAIMKDAKCIQTNNMTSSVYIPKM